MDCSRSSTKNPDRWMEQCSEFSRPICEQLRTWVIRWEPDLTEAIKWNNLCFVGRKPVCGISGCKKHVAIFFFRGTELYDPTDLFVPAENNTWIRSIKITNFEKFSREAFRKLLHAAVELDGDPDRLPPPPQKREEWPVPEYFAKALKSHKAAGAGFAALAPTYQREYLVWLTTAKREETREKRLAETLAALAAGRKWAQRKMV